MHLLLLANAPVFIILAYIYYRDKYEKEPLALLAKGLLAGMLIVLPIMPAEGLMLKVISPWQNQHYLYAFGNAFVVAALCEELFKILALYLLFWRNPNFNERFDGIVYAVFVSLGFALVENTMYVFGDEGGMHIALSRAFTAVPAHAMFGVFMGYYFGKARYATTPNEVNKQLRYALLIPILFHGLYDFILMSENSKMLLAFFPLLIYMFIIVHRQMNEHLSHSIFRFLQFRKKK